MIMFLCIHSVNLHWLWHHLPISYRGYKDSNYLLLTHTPQFCPNVFESLPNLISLEMFYSFLKTSCKWRFSSHLLWGQGTWVFFPLFTPFISACYISLLFYYKRLQLSVFNFGYLLKKIVFPFPGIIHRIK